MEDLYHITEKTACVIMETIQGDAGVRIPSKQYLQAIRRRCDETGTLLILDEIQCGMGRTGTLFAFEQFDIVPDILTVAKAFGGGLPIGAFISDKNIMATFDARSRVRPYYNLRRQSRLLRGGVSYFEGD